MKKNILYIVSLLAFASCTSNDLDENAAPVYGTDEIKLNGGVITPDTESATRAILTDVATGGMDISILRQDAASATLPSDFTVGTEKKAYVCDGATAIGGTATPVKGTVVFGTKIAVTHEYYLANGDNSRLFAWYPQTDANKVTYSGGNVTFQLDGYTDVMASKAVEGNKASGSRIGNIELKHMLSQLQFKAYEAEDGGIAMWGKITKIEVLGLAPTCVVALDVDKSKEPTATYSGDPATLQVKKADGTTLGDVDVTPFDTNDATTKAKAASCGSILIPHRAAADAALKIKVYTEKDIVGKEYSLKNANAYNQSGSCIVYLKYTVQEITPTVTISAWTTGASQDIEM